MARNTYSKCVVSVASRSCYWIDVSVVGSNLRISSATGYAELMPTQVVGSGLKLLIP
jgi:hypothetical protein